MGDSIKLEDVVSLDESLGKGTLGEVFKGKNSKGQVVAVKQIKLNKKNGSYGLTEIKTFQALEKHPNLVKMLDFHFAKNSYWIVMEFCDLGDLNAFVLTTKPNINEQVGLMKQMAQGLAHMHTQDIPVIHRGIKPTNIMFKSANGQVRLKIGDFGLSTNMDQDDGLETYLMSTEEGSPEFMAPEFFISEEYTASVDVFALGLVFLAVLKYETTAFLRSSKKYLKPVAEGPMAVMGLIPIGMAMLTAIQSGMPVSPVCLTNGSSAAERTVRKLILKMTCGKGDVRLRAWQVQQVLEKLDANPNTDVDVPEKCADSSRPPVFSRPPVVPPRLTHRPPLRQQLPHPSSSTESMNMPKSAVTVNKKRETIQLEDIIINVKESLGKGSFGEVFKGKNSSGQVVAVKQLKLDDKSDKGSKKRIDAMKEIDNFQKLQEHPNVVKMIDFHFAKKSVWVVMEFCDLGDLNIFVLRRRPDTITQVGLMKQIAAGLAHMHTQDTPVIHRDLKPANIMLKYANGHPCIKIADFGLSKIVKQNPAGDTYLMSTQGGSRAFMAPELFMPGKYTSSVDVFALGLVFLALLKYKTTVLSGKYLNPVQDGQEGKMNFIPIGMAMCTLIHANMPESPVCLTSGSSPAEITVRKLIVKMAGAKRDERLRAWQVQRVLEVLDANPHTEADVPAERVEYRKGASWSNCFEEVQIPDDESLMTSLQQGDKYDTSGMKSE